MSNQKTESLTPEFIGDRFRRSIDRSIALNGKHYKKLLRLVER